TTKDTPGRVHRTGQSGITNHTHPMLPRKFKNLKFRPNQHTRCPMPIEIPHANKKVPKIGTKTDNFQHY
ncbi:hypothetical protein COH65_11710, partial [Neisseria meningitidis]